MRVADLQRDPACAGLESLVLIGRGASGSVYRADQPALERVVALKVLDLSLDGTDGLGAFRDECAAAGRLNEHPNIVNLHGSGVLATGQPFLLMAYYSGGSLAERVARARLDMHSALRIGVRMAGALEAAHELGIIHCDVKPANVFLSRYDEPVLGDFGIATLDRRIGHRAAFTPNFAAPEVLTGYPGSAAADIYALGATIFALLAGTPPFIMAAGESYDEFASRIAASPSPIVDHPEVDQPANAAISSALRPAAEHRPRTARDFAEMLQWQQQRLGFDPTDVPGRTRTARRVLPHEAAPSAPVTASTAATPADMGLRAQAALIDLATAATVAVGAMALALALPNAPSPNPLGAVLGLVGGIAVYHLLFGALVTQSPGRRWAGLTLARDPGPGRVTLWHVAGRVLIGVGGVAALGVGYLAGLGRRGRTWPDEVTATVVATTSAPSPAPWFWATSAVTVVTVAALALATVLLLS